MRGKRKERNDKKNGEDWLEEGEERLRGVGERGRGERA